MKALLFLAVLLLLPLPAIALLAPDPNEKAVPLERVPLAAGLIPVIGVGALLAFVKKEKRFMRKNTFQFEQVRKDLREDDYED
jgi:hypothetical protein